MIQADWFRHITYIFSLLCLDQTFCLGILFEICNKTISKVEWITEQWEKERTTAGLGWFGYLVLTLMYFSYTTAGSKLRRWTRRDLDTHDETTA